MKIKKPKTKDDFFDLRIIQREEAISSKDLGLLWVNLRHEDILAIDAFITLWLKDKFIPEEDPLMEHVKSLIHNEE